MFASAKMAKCGLLQLSIWSTLLLLAPFASFNSLKTQLCMQVWQILCQERALNEHIMMDYMLSLFAESEKHRETIHIEVDSLENKV